MAEPTEAATARQAEILEVAIGVFLRYGFKKTSMDDLARAAGLSRQGLYLHFPTKEALFKAMVVYCIETMRAEARATLAREDLDLEARVLGAFEAMSSKGVGSESLDELIATTFQLVGSVVCSFEETFLADLTRVLRAAGIAGRWKDAGISVKDLAEHLFAASIGIKHQAKTLDEYRERMRVALRLVCRSVPQ